MGVNVCLGEVITLEEELCIHCARQGVGEAVSEIQGRRMSAFPVISKSSARQFSLFHIQANLLANPGTLEDLRGFDPFFDQ
jgi:hypothetical protein